MIQVHHFVFNDFLENTYVLWDETKKGIIIDPGCYRADEREDLKKYIEAKNIKPVLLLNTHCHIDHIFGNKWVKETFSIPFLMHHKDLPVLKSAANVGRMYGIFIEPSPDPNKLLEEGDEVRFGNSTLKVLFTPGHSPGSISFYFSNSDSELPTPNFIIGGDVLFQSSIGRFDLPGGDYETLMQSIISKLMPLPDGTIVYSGHGPATTIGEEKKSNPFVLEYQEMSRK